jgi:hypothetical protein
MAPRIAETAGSERDASDGTAINVATKMPDPAAIFNLRFFIRSARSLTRRIAHPWMPKREPVVHSSASYAERCLG